MVNVATERCPALTPKANFLRCTFEKAFTYFSKCRKIYDSGKILSDEEISDLGRNFFYLLLT